MAHLLRPHADLTPAERDAAFREDLHAFSQRSFEVTNNDRPIENNWHLEAITKRLDDVLKGKCRRLIINAPPRSLKSFLASVAFPAFVIAHMPSCKFVCTSYSQDLSNTHSSDTRRLMESTFYQRLFKNILLSKSTASELQTKQGGFRYATSVGGTLTGLGGDILIVDDPLNVSDVYSDTTRNGANKWFSGTLLPRLNDKQSGAIIVVMQRLHQEDLTGYLLERGGWELLDLPAIAPEDRHVQIWNGTYHWKAGEALQPNREPLYALQELKAQVGAEIFNAQYLLAPVPAGGNMLKREWLREYETAPLSVPSDQIIQSWDTALTANEKSSFSVCLTFRVRNNNEYYLIDVLRERLEFPALISHVLRLANAHRPKAILIENKASGISLIQSLRHQGLQGINKIDPEKDKKTRMYGQTPKLSAHSLILPKSAPWLDDLLLEYLAFPSGRNDDQIDALSQFLAWQSGREINARFSVDWGYDDQPGLAPPLLDELLRRFGR